TVEDQEIRVAVAPGRIAVGTALLETDEALAGVGSPWVSEALTAQAGQWPIAGALNPPQLPFSILLGASMSGDTVEAALHVTGLAQTLQMAMVLVPDAMKSLRTRTQLSRVGTDLEALRAAEQQHYAVHGEWRILERGEGWADFSPVTDGALFWTVDSPDGTVEVHAEIDADEDGVSAHYMLDTSDRFWTLTPDGVR
ncbi:MAG: hypothetical protein ACI8RZ_007569, partial [Myxococcota bacterium]